MKVVSSDEKGLLKDLINGKRIGFQKLYDLMFSPLCGFGRKYLDNTLLLEDFVQESFISFWNKRTGFNDLPSIKSYLYTSVKNSCLNHIKHQEVKRKNEPGIIQKIESDYFHSHAVIEEETFNLLHEEIKNLPKSSQKIMLLALNGMKNPEIADELGISVNSVKTLKRNSYTKIREKLSPSMQQMIFSVLF